MNKPPFQLPFSALSICLALSLLLLTACNWKGTQAMEERIFAGHKNQSTELWHATPTELRIFPGTRIIQENNMTWVDIRVELLDDMDDPIKSTGQYRFTYDILGPQGNTTTPEPIHIWDMQIRTLADQVTHYDRIARSYRFKLEIDDKSLKKGRPWVKVEYTCPEGLRLTGSKELNV